MNEQRGYPRRDEPGGSSKLMLPRPLIWRATMKLNLVKDANGKVVATFENAVAGGPLIKPVLKPGHTVHHVEVADDYKAHVAALYKHHSK
jgi:hypothetical protein